MKTKIEPTGQNVVRLEGKPAFPGPCFLTLPPAATAQNAQNVKLSHVGCSSRPLLPTGLVLKVTGSVEDSSL